MNFIIHGTINSLRGSLNSKVFTKCIGVLAVGDVGCIGRYTRGYKLQTVRMRKLYT